MKIELSQTSHYRPKNERKSNTRPYVCGQRKEIKAIREQLNEKGATVPEIAGATGIPSAEVMWYLATLKRYGLIVEGEKDGGYFRYALTRTFAE